jgi:hypothetical protein
MKDRIRVTDDFGPPAPRTGALEGVTAGGLVIALIAGAAPLAAQTDYYNLDRNRPAQVEDAYATERYAFELKAAPIRLEREASGAYHWGFDPELAYGILPRTHVEVGLPLAVIDGGDAGTRSGLTGIELSALHNVNMETRSLPALGIRADLVLPVGGLSHDRAYPSVTGLATRTYRWARIHVNAGYAFGAAPEAAEEGDPAAGVEGLPAEELSRWLAGVAIDRAFPLRALLVIGEVYARQPLEEADPVGWHAGVGFRYQVNPYLTVDAGIGHRLTGDATWHITLGSTFAFALRPFVPVPR